MQLSSWIDILAIILAVVSLMMTIVGFFASLKFYRDAVALQRLSNDALTKLEEKTQFIQAQVGGMFDKTLEAAIGNRWLLSESFSEITAQLEQTKSNIIEETLTQIGAAGEQERKRLEGIIDKQLELIRQKVETTKGSAEDIAHDYQAQSQSWVERYLLSLFENPEKGLSLQEIQNRSATYMSANRARTALSILIRKRTLTTRHEENSETGTVMKYFLNATKAVG